MEWFSLKLIWNMEQFKNIRVNKKRRKLLLCVMYAGLSIFFVPSVVCDDNEWTQLLSYEQIYNDTDFVQASRPYSLPLSSFNYKNSLRNSIQHRHLPNELGYNGRSNNLVQSKEKILVGFARDPYRQSIPVDDYAKGVRDISSSYYKSEGRGKRGVVHLYNMIHCATGCEPLSYKGYGCYCGFLGSGRPTDGIDRCCEIHDRCYDHIFCPFFTAYFQPYYWKCYHGMPLCALENRLSQDKFVNGCAARLCECDRQFAMCVKQYSCPKRPALCRSSPLRLLQNFLVHGK